MSFKIPNEADAAFADQAEPDSVDFDILAAGYSDGVISGCAVSEDSPTGLFVAVALGEVLIGSKTASVTAADLAIAAADPTDDRFDLVVVDDAGTKSVVTGTASTNPVFPAIPANSIVIAAVFVDATDTLITDSQITDKRIFIRPASGATTFFVAANDADQASKEKADYLCNGTADDVEIQAAIDALPANGGRVILSEGIFTIATALVLDDSQVLEGQGFTTQLDRTTSGDVIDIIGTSGNHKTNVEIRYLRVTGPSVVGSQISGIGVAFDWNDFSKIESCWISGFGSTGDQGALRFRHSLGCKSTNNSLSASENGLITGTATSVDFPEADRCEFVGNLAYDNWADGMHSQQSARLLYNNNVCWDNAESGIDLLGDADDTIVGNISYSNTQAGIETGNTTATGSPDTGHTISGNTCFNNGTQGIFINSDSEFITVDGNTCRDNVSSGIQLAGIGTPGNRYCVISNNTCENNTVRGISIVNAPNEDHLIIGNVVRNNNNRGIYIVDAGGGDPVGVVVMGNYVEGNTTADIADNTVARTNLKIHNMDGSLGTVEIGHESALAIGQAGAIPSATTNDVADFLLTVPYDMTLLRIVGTVKTKPTSNTTFQVRRSTNDGDTFSNAFGTVVITAAGNARSFSANPADLDVDEGDVLNYSVTVGGGDGTNALVEIIGVAR